MSCVVVLLVMLVVVVCVWCVCVCLCVLRHAEKTWKSRVWIQKRLRVHIQNVPVYAGTIHGDVSNGHTGSNGVIVSSAYKNLPTYG